MRFSEAWLREIVKPKCDRKELLERLTMAGLELEKCEAVASHVKNVVVGQIKSIQAHPDADQLQICQVDVGQKKLLNIVTAATIKSEWRLAVALNGAELANDRKVTTTILRGQTSEGMFCSLADLGMEVASEQLLVLPSNAPLGQGIYDLLQLDDYAIELSITPNRGDCLSVYGIAREVAAIFSCDLSFPKIPTIKPTIDAVLSVTLDSAACPQYVGRIIKNVDLTRPTPLWLSERLRRSGLRSIDPIVDVTNYVLLEMGQPMHAFDLAKLNSDIHVRQAKVNEQLILLDGKSITLSPEHLVIADQKNAIALAGIMGGEATAISTHTQDIFLESAFFAPMAIAGKARGLGLQTDSSYRFERGVDPSLQRAAIERATQLLLDIVGGEAGPITEAKRENELPVQRQVELRPQRVKQILGVDLSSDVIQNCLQRLGMKVIVGKQAWQIHVPLFRFDITIEADLIEEVARNYGYDKIAAQTPTAKLHLTSPRETRLDPTKWCDRLRERGYSEAINYAFVDPQIQQLFFPDQKTLSLINPISEDLSQMRLSLWPGLITAARRNLYHQQERVRLFEMGLGFQFDSKQSLQQRPLLAAIAMGAVEPEQWGSPKRDIDFYDVKADLIGLLGDLQYSEDLHFQPAEQAALHPGQCARILFQQTEIGWIGVLHPELLQKLNIKNRVCVFEIQLDALPSLHLPQFKGFPKFPSLRRDLSFIVDSATPAQAIIETVTGIKTDILQEVAIFDIFTGKDMPEGKKSIAIKIILQHPGHTLTDSEVDACISEVKLQLQRSHNITMRE